MSRLLERAEYAEARAVQLENEAEEYMLVGIARDHTNIAMSKSSKSTWRLYCMILDAYLDKFLTEGV